MRSLATHGAFAALEHGPLPFDALCARIGANAGPLRIVLDLLRVKRLVAVQNGGFALGPSYAGFDLSDLDGVEALYNVGPLDLLCSPRGRDALAARLEAAARGWASGPEWALMLDGPALLPTVIGLHQLGVTGSLDEIDATRAPGRETVRAYFLEKGWVDRDDAATLTAAGKFMVGRAMNGGVAASYWPLLGQMDALLFGDADRVMARDGDDEAHIDRSLNVRSSGFQHDKYFKDMRKALAQLSADGWNGAPPAYLADMGCGDGSLLKALHATLAENGVDARMVGLDLNAAALDETAKTLAGLPHILMTADIADPARLARDFAAREGEGHGRILHVRSFLDHDRTYVPSPDAAAVVARIGLPFSAAAIGPGGDLISPAALYQNLVEHLSAWAEMLEGHGLFCLEVHTMSLWAKGAFFELSEGFYFDAIQAFSHQYICEPEAFLAAMAEAGLFPIQSFKRYPKGFPFTRMTMGYYERRPWRIRFATPADGAALAAAFPDAAFDAAQAERLALRDAIAGFVIETMDGRRLGGLFCDIGPFDGEAQRREVVLSAGVAADPATRAALFGHAHRFFSVQDGETVIASRLDPAAWAFAGAPVDPAVTVQTDGAALNA